MNKGIKPREYQKECLAAIDKTIARGEKRALVVMASGLGKTYTAAFAVEKFYRQTVWTCTDSLPLGANSPPVQKGV